MEIKVNDSLFTRNVEASEIENGFKVRAHGCALSFIMLGERHYDIYEEKEKFANFRCCGSHIWVTASNGEVIMNITDAGAGSMSDKELCRLVAEMIARWNEM